LCHLKKRKRKRKMSTLRRHSTIAAVAAVSLLRIRKRIATLANEATAPGQEQARQAGREAVAQVLEAVLARKETARLTRIERRAPLLQEEAIPRAQPHRIVQEEPSEVAVLLARIVRSSEMTISSRQTQAKATTALLLLLPLPLLLLARPSTCHCQRQFVARTWANSNDVARVVVGEELLGETTAVRATPCPCLQLKQIRTRVKGQA